MYTQIGVFAYPIRDIFRIYCLNLSERIFECLQMRILHFSIRLENLNQLNI